MYFVYYESKTVFFVLATYQILCPFHSPNPSLSLHLTKFQFLDRTKNHPAFLLFQMHPPNLRLAFRRSKLIQLSKWKVSLMHFEIVIYMQLHIRIHLFHLIPISLPIRHSLHCFFQRLRDSVSEISKRLGSDI